MTRSPGEHRDLGTVAAAASVAVIPGPIAVLPRPEQRFVDAVIAGGGEVSPLSSDTRGVVWLSEHAADELALVLEAHPQVQWVQLPWAGVDAFAHVLESFSARPLPVWTSAKGAYSEPVAEHALALILATLRCLPEKARTQSWIANPKIGTSVFGQHVLIVGAGGIARELVRLLAVFDVTVTIVRRSGVAVDGVAQTVTADRLHDVLPTADVVVLAAASTDETAHLVGRTELNLMKSTAVLVNVARGALVDQDALAHALATNSIAGAGLDVTSPEPLPDSHALWNEPRCIITSHSADTPEMTAPLLATRVTTNVRAFLSGSPFVGVVDTASGY